MEGIRKYKSSIDNLCIQYKVDTLHVFGSILTEHFNSESDVDFIVVFKKSEIDDYFSNFFDFKYSLEELFGRPVDLIEEQSIRNPYFRQNVDASKVLVYG